MVLLEVCIDSVESARVCANEGVLRVELCTSLSEGGLTPSIGLIKACRQILPPTTQLMVLIRPRGGDFCYTEDELLVMEEDVRESAAGGANGVVFGALRPDGRIDAEAVSALLTLARSLQLDVTVHRCIDVSRDLLESIDTLAELGVPRVLSSGGCSAAAEGAPVLRAMVERAAGRLTVMAGAGVNRMNVVDIVRSTGCTEVHASCGWGRRSRKSLMKFLPANGLSFACPPLSDREWGVAERSEIRAILDLLPDTMSRSESDLKTFKFSL